MSHYQGPCLVLAGPGSGKTYTLTCRIRNLIHSHGVIPERILVITFTRAAAQEMKQRFDSLMQQHLPVNFGTFHSVFYHMLLESSSVGADAFLTEKAKYQILREVAAACDLDTDQKDFFSLLSRELSYMKNTGADPRGFDSVIFADKDMGRIYHCYEGIKQAYGVMDLDDIMTKTLEMLRNNERVLRMWQERFAYLLVDEAQDMNILQFQIIRLLALPENHLFLVGDDDQSIYGFRGAAVDILTRFRQYYPGCRQIILEENYRSADKIADAAARLISHNQMRCKKQMQSVREVPGTVETAVYDDSETEAEETVNKIQELVKKGKDLKKMAILCRRHVQLQEIIMALQRKQIPFYLKDYMKNPWKHWIIRDMLSYMKLADAAEGTMERSVILAVMNRPCRYLSRSSLRGEEITFAQWKRYYQGKRWVTDRLDLLQKQLLQIKTLSGFSALYFIRNEIGYDRYIREYVRTHPEEQEWEQALELIQSTARGTAGITELVQRVEDMTEKIDEENERKTIGEGLGLYTIHGAKGLEFDVVFLPGCNEGECPSKHAKTPEQMEEERRIFYVGLTRAKEMLYLSCVRKSARGTRPPSRFLDEIRDQSISRNSASSQSSLYFSSTSSNSSSERILSTEGVPSSSSL